MTVEVCTRMGIRTPQGPGVSKDDSTPGGAISRPRHIASETSNQRPKFMITDILSQRTISADPGPEMLREGTTEEPKDLTVVRHHLQEEDGEDDDIDLDAEGSQDEDELSDGHTPKEHDGDEPPPSKKQRKARTAFSDQQLQTLEKSFERQKYLSVQDRMELAVKLNLTDTQVKTWYQNRRTKWKRQTAVGLELLAEAGNYAAVQRLYGTTTGYMWPYPSQPSPASAAVAAAAAASALNHPSATSMDLYYRQAALQKPLSYRLFPPTLPLLPLQADPLRDSLRLEALRPPEAFRPDILRPDFLRSLVVGSVPPSSLAISTAPSPGKNSLNSSPLTASSLTSSPLSSAGSPLPTHTSLSFYRNEAASQV